MTVEKVYCYLEIQEPEDFSKEYHNRPKPKILYHQDFNSKTELSRHVKELRACGQRQAGITDVLLSLLYPKYTSPFKEFCLSLFTPTTWALYSTREITNEMLQREGCWVNKTTLYVLTFLADLVTLGIRLATAVPVLLYKAVKGNEDSKIIRLIKGHPLAAKAIESGKLVVAEVTGPESYAKTELHDVIL